MLLVITPVAATAVMTGDMLAPVYALFYAAIFASFAFSSFSPFALSSWLTQAAPEGLVLLTFMLLMQGLSIFTLAGFARDAIQRRKWEGR
jgi:hypothetical protein